MNEEGIRKRIRILLDEIQTEVDPVLLNRCRSIFRQEVSFFHRSYLAAYLLLLAEEGKAAIAAPGGRFAGKRETKAGDTRNKTRSKERTEVPRSFLSEEESARLFVSVGRNRKVFPRDILALINARTKTPREDIGTIRVLDNYSFIQVRSSIADTVIQALNGQNFRGRTLTVSYARSRREGEEDNTDIQPEREREEQ